MGTLTGDTSSIRLQPAAQLAEHATMDESTRQVVKALERSIELQLKPIQDRQEEILDELRSSRQRSQTLETEHALMKDRVDRLKRDLDKGLDSVRRQVADTNKRYAPLFAAIPGIVALLLGLAVYFLRP